MPKRIFIIALLFCLTGGFAIYSIIDGFFNDHLRLDLTVFTLPVGVGLFKGKLSSRKWAKFWIFIGYAIFGGMLLLISVYPSSVQAELFGVKYKGEGAMLFACGIFVVFLGILIVIQRLLNSDKTDAYFRRKSKFSRSHKEQKNLRRENALEHKQYRQFMVQVEGVEQMTSKQRHEEFRRWKATTSSEL